jgi:uncharacterized membrane protein YadS
MNDYKTQEAIIILIGTILIFLLPAIFEFFSNDKDK